MTPTTPEGEKVARWRKRPDIFVREVFGITPDEWQDDVLRAFPGNPRIAMKACKGPGKTAVLAWLCWNFLLTRQHPKIAATSITAENLADNLWTEMAKWLNRSELLRELFTWNKTRIEAKHHPETWWMSARTWPKSADPSQQANTLAGLHADYLLFILDESGGIPESVMVAAEAGLSSCIEGHIVQAGNPTHLTGPLYNACTRDRHKYHVTEITGDPDDPKRSPRVSVEWARDQIATYGADNPWVLVNVFGRFPPSSLNSLIGPDEVRDAMKRHLRIDQYGHAARVLGVDVARFGDDASIIFPRQGLVAFKPRVLRNVDSFQGAGHVNQAWAKWGAHAAMVDATGGYGAGWIDALKQIGRDPVPVQFAGKPLSAKYFNKRAEMWFLMADWVKAGGCLPDIPELLADLITPTYSFKGDKLLVEDKDQIKQRLGRSPDWGDGLALTFAFPVSPPDEFERVLGKQRDPADDPNYNPIEALRGR